jgi:hypothetical protein
VVYFKKIRFTVAIWQTVVAWCVPISGVVCWLYTMGSLAVYTLLSDMYEDQARNLPLYDLGRTAQNTYKFISLPSPSIADVKAGSNRSG